MDHFDKMLTSMRERLAHHRAQEAAGDFFAGVDAARVVEAIAELEREAAVERAKTPDQLAAEDAARVAKWEAFHEDCERQELEDEDEDEELGDE